MQKMMVGSASALSSYILLLALMMVFLAKSALAWNVTYDYRSLIIDGQKKLLISASIHYPRSVPAMWPSLIETAKKGGIDVIETYVFWNGHEPSPGNYYFGGRFDLVEFLKLIQAAGLYSILRIGPFVAAEWNFGGVPVWLHYIPGTTFRTNSTTFESHMESFTKYIVNLMKRKKLFASQGGPIILSQIENEYGYYEPSYGEGGKKYAMWAANMAVSQNTGVPWIMCQQFDAPDIVINTCNSFYCDQFTPIYKDKPKIWTENWPGWFKTFGSRDPHRPPEDVAYSVARFFQNGGALQNYYMYHGGTNFGRTSGGPFITTSYDYDAPIDEYGLARQPKWGHLKDLHEAIKLCEHAILNGVLTNISLGPLQEAHVYEDETGKCSAFIANMDDKSEKTVIFRNMSYALPAWSVSILPDCRSVVFNTAKVNSQTSIIEMLPSKLVLAVSSHQRNTSNIQWEVFEETPGIWGKADFVRKGLVDHINTTKDSTDYLWYSTSVFVSHDEEFLQTGNRPILIADSRGHATHVFVNGQYIVSASGSGLDSKFKFEISIPLKAGENEISLLSMTVGLQNAGPFYEWVGAGFTSIKLEGFNSGILDLTSNVWKYKIGLEGEHLNIFREDGMQNVRWKSTINPPTNQTLIWYKAIVDAPYGDDPVGLDMTSMGKGQAWLNGEPIGRYWPRTSSINDNCVSVCDYRGKFQPDKCDTGCGDPTQRWYHVPRSWFRTSANVLVIFEEKGGDPTKISFSRRLVTGACGLVSEDYPSLKTTPDNRKNSNKASLHLACPDGTRISSIKFASFGTPTGKCGSYKRGTCHDPLSTTIVKQACLYKEKCRVILSNENFDMNLCPGSVKSLAVEAVCS
ncbi:unnamed protein product [Victoria cruziana]